MGERRKFINGQGGEHQGQVGLHLPTLIEVMRKLPTSGIRLTAGQNEKPSRILRSADAQSWPLRVKAHPVAVPPHQEPEAIVLDFMDPAGGGWRHRDR